MAKAEDRDNPTAAPTVSEGDKSKARQWFKRAGELREKRNYDYAIECYLIGLWFWSEAVEEGHMPLRSLSVQRAQAGGKKPSFMDSMKSSMSGRDAVKALLNAEKLLSMDPFNGTYAEGLLKNAVKAGLIETAKFAAPVVFEALRKEKKPNKAKFKTFRDVLVEAAALASSRGDNPSETFLLTQAVEALEYLIARTPADEELRGEQRELAGKLAIARGKYEGADTFRESLRDADSQKLLHDQDRSQQADETLASVVDTRRKEWEADPTSVPRLNAFVDTLVRSERKKYEDEAVSVLLKQYEESRNYAHKFKADDIRLRQLTRQVRTLRDRARSSGHEDDAQQARLAALEQRETALEVFEERVREYPTDLRLKYQLGRTLFEAERFDEAIPMLQAAQADPRARHKCQLYMGQAFLAKDNAQQARDVLREAADAYELTDDHSKELLYWLGRACEAAGDVAGAKDAFGKLLRQDYNFMDGDARKRLETLNKSN
ncbi:MAG: hypothetical protein IPM18_01320 [Phycisphaerales bacterium]|nr:hypothetical protein [Phycisphaerales bacterium]